MMKTHYNSTHFGIAWWPPRLWGIALRGFGWYAGILLFRRHFRTFAVYRVPVCIRCGQPAYMMYEEVPDGPRHVGACPA